MRLYRRKIVFSGRNRLSHRKGERPDHQWIGGPRPAGAGIGAEPGSMKVTEQIDAPNVTVPSKDTAPASESLELGSGGHNI
jgi:hypothetical protein